MKLRVAFPKMKKTNGQTSSSHRFLTWKIWWSRDISSSSNTNSGNSRRPPHPRRRRRHHRQQQQVLPPLKKGGSNSNNSSKSKNVPPLLRIPPATTAAKIKRRKRVQIRRTLNHLHLLLHHLHHQLRLQQEQPDPRANGQWPGYFPHHPPGDSRHQHQQPHHQGA